ncbi:MAG: hypothetical protein RDU14_16650 [Melioribacteraceae bacterium]|nr:hypothetical protein [Melioribacteraceae bacterium]
MKISFDYDGTFTDPKIREIAKSLLDKHEVFILTCRFGDNMREVYLLAEKVGIKRENVLCTNLKDKGDYILENNLQFDIHFDDDYFDVDSINNKTKTSAFLVDLTLHPNNTRITDGGLIVPKN